MFKKTYTLKGPLHRLTPPVFSGSTCATGELLQKGRKIPFTISETVWERALTAGVNLYGPVQVFGHFETLQTDDLNSEDVPFTPSTTSVFVVLSLQNMRAAEEIAAMKAAKMAALCAMDDVPF